MEEDIRKDFLWNSISGIIDASEAIIMMLIVTRVSGLDDAGILTISFAVGNLLMTIGKFGVRTYQVSDIAEEFERKVYYVHRFITIFLMLVILVIYLLYASEIKGYSQKKILAVALMTMIYTIEAFEDVILGDFQNKKKLYIGAQIFCFRWVAILVTYTLGMVMTNNLIEALFFALIASVIIFVFLWKSKVNIIKREVKDVNLRYKISFEKWDDIKWISIGKLTLRTIPLFFSEFLYFYVCNSTKYALDGRVSDAVQGCFGFISMPVFVISLLSSFIYYPRIGKMSRLLNEQDIGAFKHRVCNQLLVILGLAICVIVGGYLVGIPILSLLYATPLVEYRIHLMILLFGSFFLAISRFLGAVLTVLRKQNMVLIGYLGISLLMVSFLPTVVEKYGVLGASVGYTLAMIILAVLFFVLYLINIVKVE